ncbi:MAG TPA: hypothetical protein VHP80_10975, partial [Candidatus Acidoferrum sp.]|nr:hypothetical protein [Candidatus Acidoferrum sp.]
AKLEKLVKTTDGLRDRFGFDAVQFGGSIRHGERNSNEGWGRRETKRKDEPANEKSRPKPKRPSPGEWDFDPD